MITVLCEIIYFLFLQNVPLVVCIIDPNEKNSMNTHKQGGKTYNLI